MKKLLTSASLLVVGAASLQAQYAPAPELSTVQTSKPWSVSATLRGFYDDNYSTLPSHVSTPTYPTARDSFGFEVSPSFSLNFTLPQTYIGLSYVYGLRYYEDRKNDSADHSHQFTAKLNHAFTERYKLDLSDSLVVAQEPELLNPSNNLVTLPLRADGSNVRNTANANFTADVTEEVGALVGYSNSLYDYELDGPGSYSSLLDRMEHQIMLNLRWRVQPTTVGILGYQYGITDFTSKDSLGIAADPTLTSSTRDSKSHYVYVGLDQAINPKLNASARVGAQFVNYDNAPVGSEQDAVSPYADANLTYNYNPGSYAQLGVRHSRSATDILAATSIGGATNLTLDQESTLVYTSVNHRIGDLTASLIGQFQNSSFQGGSVDSQEELYWTAGLNLSYDINKFVAAEAGYNYDKLDSDVQNRSYSRNRVYIGIRATY